MNSITFGPLGRQHQPDVQESTERMTLGGHARHHRLDNLAHDARVERARRPADSARTRPSRRYSVRGRRRRCACDPAPCRSARLALRRKRRKNDTSGPAETLFDDEPVAGGAEPPLRHRRDDRVLPPSARSSAMTTPFPAASPSALSTTGHPNSPARTMPSASSAESQVWNRAVGTPWRAMNAFANALLDSRRAAAAVGPNSRRPSAAKRSAMPRLSGSSGPTTVKSICSRSARAGSASRSADIARKWCVRAGRCRDFRARRRSRRHRGRRPGDDERVLARAAADDQNSHCVKGLGRAIRLHAEWSGRDYFVDLDWGLRLESAFTCDSVTYLTIFATREGGVLQRG